MECAALRAVGSTATMAVSWDWAALQHSHMPSSSPSGPRVDFLAMFIARFLSPKQTANMPRAPAPAYECF